MRRAIFGWIFGLATLSASAQAQPAPAPAPPPAPIEPLQAPLIEVHGYVQPQFGIRHRPTAVLRDRWEYGGLGSRAGIILTGTPIPRFGYVLHFSLDGRGLRVLTGVDLLDTNGDNAAEGLVTSRASIISTVFEEVTVSYSPFDFLVLKLGAMRAPFTVSLKSANTQLMFANRPGAMEIFQAGSDQGILAFGDWLEGRIQASGGIFTGSSLGLLPDYTDARGLMYSARVDGNPLGRLPRAETDFERKPLRFGLGMGTQYRGMTLYTKQGYELSTLRDFRASASARVAAYGFSFQGEAFRRLATDNVSYRPNRATGAYAQASFFFPVGTVGFAPIARIGTTVEDELTMPRRTTFLEGGLSFFPKVDQPRPESVRFLLQYIGEFRSPEEDQAHAGLLQAQVIF